MGFFEKGLDIFVATYYNKIVATKKERCKMSAIKKGTKLTENPKDYMLRVRMDEKTVEMLDSICDRKKLSRSEVVRLGIKEQYEKEK